MLTHPQFRLPLPLLGTCQDQVPAVRGDHGGQSVSGTLANQTGVFGEPGYGPDGVITTAEIGGNHGTAPHLLQILMLAWLR